MGRCIMVVEDEPLVRMLLADHLREEQFEVAEAGDADEAVRLLMELPAVAAVISDVRMPGSMNGLELAERIASTSPLVKVILTSGYLATEDNRLPATATFVPKPYQAEQISALLRDRLAVDSR